MRLYIDSADLEELGHLPKTPYFKGVTTNPALIAQNMGKNEVTDTEYFAFLRKIRDVIKGELFIQLISQDYSEAVYEIAKIREIISQPLVIKIPATQAGFYAVSRLAKEGIDTAATAVYTPTQAFFAVAAGAKYVIPYYSRIDQYEKRGIDTIQDILSVAGEERVLVASVKTAADLHYLILSGVRNVTLPYELAKNVSYSEFTEEAIEEFAEKLQVNWSRKKK